MNRVLGIRHLLSMENILRIFSNELKIFLLINSAVELFSINIISEKCKCCQFSKFTLNKYLGNSLLGFKLHLFGII